MDDTSVVNWYFYLLRCVLYFKEFVLRDYIDLNI